MEILNSKPLNKLDYSNYLKVFIDKVNEENINVIMLYIPMFNTSQHSLTSRRYYFKKQAEIHSIPFIDTTDVLSSYPEEWIYNQPFDSHLTRFGHLQLSHIILEELNVVTDIENDGKRKAIIRGINGPHPKNVDTVNRYNQLAYRVQTNSQGFRMLYDIQPNKKLIMILGDSFTYGTGVNTFESYPNILNQLLKGINIINSGIPGSSIIEQSSYFNSINNKAMVDTLVIQVLDNDIK